MPSSHPCIHIADILKHFIVSTTLSRTLPRKLLCMKLWIYWYRLLFAVENWQVQFLCHKPSVCRRACSDITIQWCVIAVVSSLMWVRVDAQVTIDDSDICHSSLPTSEQVANLIREGVEKVMVSNQQQCAPMETSKHALVSALEYKY